MGYDVNSWGGVWGSAIEVNAKLSQYAGPGGWNDIDALIGSTSKGVDHLTPAQSRTQFTLWSVMSAPLIIGSNILNMEGWDLETYSNTEVIAIDQDPLGSQGQVIYQACTPGAGVEGAGVGGGPPTPPCQQIWLKPLHDGAYALAFANFTFVNSDSTGTATSDGARPAATVSEGGNGGSLALAACNASDQAQLWDITTAADGISTIKAVGDTDPTDQHPGCWEINACNYQAGTGVDARFGCKTPASANATGCAANMAWRVNPNGTITSAVGGLCFAAFVSGGQLGTCSGAPNQQFKISGAAGKQTILSHTGFGCVSNGEPAQPDGKLVYDVVTGLGWKGGAAVRDLWQHKDLGTMASITVTLPAGNGSSVIFKLTKPAVDAKQA